jgi:iron complex outermembrane receptor protein
MAGAMTATTLALWSASPPSALADEPGRRVVAQLGGDSMRFAIPAQPLASALTQFGEQAGVSVLVPAERVAGIASPGVSGELSPQAALDRLLAGSGLIARTTEAGAVTVETIAGTGDGATVLGPITVEAQGTAAPTAIIGPPPPPFAGGQVASGAQLGLLGNRNVFDTPFNQTSFTEQLIRDQQARTVADVVANDPSVRVTAPRSSTVDEYNIRGLPVAQSDLGFDGLFGLFEGTRPGVEWVECAEILKGTSALLNGVPPRGSIGGTVNLVPKRAGEDPLVRLTGSYVSETQLGGHVDTSRRAGPNGEFGVRFNGAYRDGDTPVDHLDQSFGVGAGALDYRGERLRLTADFLYTRQDINGVSFGIGVLPGFAVPDAPDADVNFAQPWEHADDTLKLGVGRAEYDLTDQITVYGAYGRSEIDEFFVAPSQTITNEDGDFDATTNVYPTLLKAAAFDVGTRASLTTGPIDHLAVVSASGFTRDSYFRFDPAITYTSNIFDPVRVPKPDTSGFSRGVGRRNNEVLARTIAVVDTLSALDERIQLTLGGRFQKLQEKNFDADNGRKTSDYSDTKATPAIAVLVKPLAALSIYGNYIEGLQIGPTAPVTADNAGETFPPFTAEQYEIGAKYDFGDFGVTVAVFQITRQNAFTDPETNIFDVDGEQRNRGLEFNLFGEPIAGVRLLGGVTYLDAELTKTEGGSDDGNTAIGVPDLAINLYGEWDLPFAPGVTLTGRAIYTSSQYVDQANTQQIPSWTRFDLGGRYTFDIRGKEITVLAAVENVTDSNYWASAAFGSLTLGAPRTFLLSTSFTF